jgi:hypothetical protein
MTQSLLHLKYEVELKQGDKLQVPAALAELLGPGRWIITVAPAPYDPFEGRWVEDEDNAEEHVQRRRGDEVPF